MGRRASGVGGERRALKQLEALVATYGEDAAARKLACLRALERPRLSSPDELLRLHEALCFLRAYPDEAVVLEQVERMLAGFAGRADLRRLRSSLADTGIAGTDIHFPFFAPQARWLAGRYGAALSIDWPAYEERERLRNWLEALVLESEVPAIYDYPLPVEEWLQRLKRPDESDACFLVRSLEALGGAPAARAARLNGLDVPFRIDGARGGPNRTGARYPGSQPFFRSAPLRRARPDLAAAVRVPPRSVRALSASEGRKLIELAREAMATRSRDLDSFAYADPRDVRMVDCGDGLELACMGLLPEQRIVVEALYAFLILQSGVPTGYALASALYRSSDIAYNVFETFRGGEAGHVYGRILATVHALFGSDSFCITPYQLGHGNAEGLESGAWWFYQKLGFRPRETKILRRMKAELARQRRDPRHRSSRAVLEELSSRYVYWFLDEPREDVIGVIPLERISLAVVDSVARRFGSDRKRGVRVMADEAAARVGIRGWRGWPRGERLAWERWSPLLLLLPGVERWSAANRRALACVVRAKGGRRESDYLALFDRHAPLKRALLRVAPRS